MKIKWFGTASLLIEGGNTRILVDPYLKRYNPKLPALPVEEAATAQAAFITHPHLDHFCDIGIFLERGLPAVYVSENGIGHARQSGIPTERMHAICAGETYTVGDITVRIFQSRHCRFDLLTILGVALNPATYCRFKDGVAILKQTKNFRITDDIFALEFSCGEKTVMALGSAGMDAETRYPQGADLLVFPYQGRAFMHRYMRRFLTTFHPKAVMCDHFDNAFPPISHTVNTKKFVAAVKKKIPEARAFVPSENIWYEV